jgi:hypothetical protein
VNPLRRRGADKSSAHHRHLLAHSATLLCVVGFR